MGSSPVWTWPRLYSATLDSRVAFSARVDEGARVQDREALAIVHGPARALLTAERTALNFLGRMSGIATLTRQFVDAVAGTRAVILDTRKTAPGLRAVDKLAVLRGGGQNHRIGLYDMILIKDNHIDFASGFREGIEEAVSRARAVHSGLQIEVEARSVDDVKIALGLGVERILLDNMSIEMMSEAVKFVNRRATLEASGNVTLETVRQIAETGVDYISSGALTHSAKVFDLSLKWLTFISEATMNEKEMYQALKQKLERVVPDVELRYKAKLAVEINRLKKEKNAVILGHNYMEPALFYSIPDFVGDSLELSRKAAQTDKDIIIFCGVKFMAETAKILNPTKTVLIPSDKAGCSLAESITADDVRALKARFPGVPVVTYVNTYADVKAESDICCTSGNAAAVVQSLKADTIIFLPDEYLARNVAKETGKHIIFPAGHPPNRRYFARCPNDRLARTL